MNRALIFLILLLSALLLLPGTVHGQTTLYEFQKQIENQVAQGQASKTASIGVFVKDIKTGQIIYSKNGEMPLVPASNLKVLTTAAAFALLGSKYTYKTTIYGGPIDPRRGIMETSLYLVGSGDPTFTEPFTDQPTRVFEQFAKLLYQRGLRRVKGDLVGDDSAFDRDFVGKGWKTRYILDSYAAECGGLSLNSNLLQILVSSNGVTLIPDSPAMKIQNKTTPGGYSEVKLARDTTQNSIVLTGSTGEAPGGGTIPVHDPPLFATSCFGKIIQDKGIYISGRVRTIDPQNSKYSYKSFIPLCTHESPSLFEIARPLNKESDNFLAQQLFRTLGAELKGKGSLKNSEAVIREFMEKAGIATEGLSMADGCGLSNFNRVTPRQLAEVLEYMYSHREGKKFMATLPKAGVDGTLKYRLAGTKVVAKTGTINENSSLSGYVTTQAGQVLVFSIISSNHTLGQGFYKDMEDRIVNTLAHWNKEL